MTDSDGSAQAAFPGAGGAVDGSVSGVSGGQVAIGGKVIQIDAEQGAHVVINADTEVQIVRRPAPVLRPPPDFPGLVGRTADLQRIRASIDAGVSVEVVAPGGFGKTALLRAASNRPLGPKTPDGVVAVPSRLGVPDTLSFIFDACYAGTRRIVPRREELASSLQPLRLLVVLDDTSLTREDVDAVREALPSAVFLLSAIESRVSVGTEGIALRGLDEADGIRLIEATLGRQLSARERDVGSQVCGVLRGVPLELVRFGALVKADAGDLVSVARGFGVDAQPEDLIVAVQRSTSADEDAVLAALAAFDAPVGAGPVAAFTGRPNTGELLTGLAHRGLVQGDDLQGWRARISVESAMPDRHRAATVLVTWARGQSVPEAVAGEIPAISRALRSAHEDRRWLDAVTLAAAAEQAFALAGRWAVWEDTLRAGLDAAQEMGDPASSRFFSHQMAVMEEAMTGEAVIGPPPDVRAQGGPSDAGREHPPPPPPRPWWQRGVVLAGLALALVVLASGVYLLASGGTGPESEPGPSPTTTKTSSAPRPTESTGNGGGTTAEPNLVAFTLEAQEAVIEQGSESPFAVRVWNQPRGDVGTAAGGVLTVMLDGSAAQLVAGFPDCVLESPTRLQCEFGELGEDETANFEVALRGMESGSVNLTTAVRDSDGNAGRGDTRQFTVIAQTTTCTVPDLIGIPVDDAAARLSRLGLEAEQIGVEDGSGSGLVITQQPSAGSEVDCGSTVTIEFSTVL